MKSGQATRVAFQGERGAFSEQAALMLLGPAIETVPRATFSALFSAIAEATADLALAPVENTLAGTVAASVDRLLESGLHAIGEAVLPIELHLIGTTASSLEQLTTVESHPVALAQCERFLAANPQLERRATLDTAGSVREILETNDPRRAAIAGEHAAKIHGGRILRRNVEDHRENYTRFLLLSATPEAAPDANKLSLVMELAHQPGALHRALGVFARRGMQLHKIESRPIPGRPWQYRFYLDVQASTGDAAAREALEELRECTDCVHVLGCYVAHGGGRG